MSDFTFSNKESTGSESKLFSFAKATKKQAILSIKLALFIAVFFGMVFLSLSSEGFLLNELLLGGGILSLLFFVHIASNK